MEEGRKDGAPNAGKSVPTGEEETSVPNKGRSAGKGKEVKEDGRREGGAHGQATRSAARMEEKLSRRAKKEGGGALWQRSPRGV